MQKSEIEDLLERYDLAESTLLEVSWRDGFRDLMLRVEYFWDFNRTGVPAGREQPVEIRLRGVLWAAFQSPRKFCETHVWDAPVTIDGWGIDSDVAKDLAHRPDLRAVLADGYHYVFFGSSHNMEGHWLQLLCRSIEIERLTA